MSLDLRLTAQNINEVLWRTGKTISTAESCTSGRIASIITSATGASAYFRGGLVAYAEDIKADLLKVDADLMAQKTAVCEDVVRQMVHGANALLGSDYSVAVSGFAGPGGPDPKTGLRVGTIWIAAGNAEHMETLLLTDDEGREHNIQRATQAALRLLLNVLRRDLPAEEVEDGSEISATAE